MTFCHKIIYCYHCVTNSCYVPFFLNLEYESKIRNCCQSFWLLLIKGHYESTSTTFVLFQVIKRHEALNMNTSQLQYNMVITITVLWMTLVSRLTLAHYVDPYCELGFIRFTFTRILFTRILMQEPIHPCKISI